MASPTLNITYTSWVRAELVPNKLPHQLDEDYLWGLDCHVL